MTAPRSAAQAASVGELQRRLERLHANGHPAGLGPAEARGLAVALEAGAPLGEVAARFGLDRALAERVQAAGSKDGVVALQGALLVAGEAAAGAQALRSAGTYPLVLAASVALSGAVVAGLLVPQVEALPMGAAGGLGPLLALGLAVSVLVLLALAVFTRLPLPLLGPVWARIEAQALLGGTLAFLEAGATLPGAVRAAAGGLSRGAAEEGRALAAWLEAGAGDGAAPREGSGLLHPYEVAQLVAAARAGAALHTLRALLEHRRLALERALPEAAARIELLSLLVAGSGLLGVGAAFFSLYTPGMLE